MVDALHPISKPIGPQGYNSAVSPPLESVYANANWFAPIRLSSIIAAFDKVILLIRTSR